MTEPLPKTAMFPNTSVQRLPASSQRSQVAADYRQGVAGAQASFTQLDLFDLVVVENGALLYDPRTDTEELIADSASTALVERLRDKGVSSLSVGRSVIATWHPFEDAVISSIRELGLELQMTFNKDAIMVLPTGVNKASGLSAALLRLGICELNVVGVGDAENDHAFLAICGCAAAVNNAIDSIKARADICLSQDHGRGVCELIDMLLQKDAALVPVERIGVQLGRTADARKVWLPPESVLLVIGNSGSGKSSYVTWLTERMVEAHQGFCIIDPEGDYLSLDGAVTVGGLTTPPTTEESLHHLLQARLNVVVSTLALDPAARVAVVRRITAVYPAATQQHRPPVLDGRGRGPLHAAPLRCVASGVSGEYGGDHRCPGLRSSLPVAAGRGRRAGDPGQHRPRTGPTLRPAYAATLPRIPGALIRARLFLSVGHSSWRRRGADGAAATRAETSSPQRQVCGRGCGRLACILLSQP